MASGRDSFVDDSGARALVLFLVLVFFALRHGAYTSTANLVAKKGTSPSPPSARGSGGSGVTAGPPEGSERADGRWRWILGVSGFFACKRSPTKEKRIATELRINDRIRVPQVRVVGADGAQIGIVDTDKALEMAAEQELDLVEVAGQADPPVCRIMDYGKYKYDQAVRQKEARKKQSNVVVKEMKMRPKIDRHDYGTKKGHVIRFLKQGAKVKVTIMFRGREMAHAELGRKLLDQLAADVADIAKVDTMPKLDGRNMTMVLGPYKEAVVQRPAPVKQRSPRVPEDEEPTAVQEVQDVQDVQEVQEEQEEQAAAPAASKRPKVTRAEGG